MQKQSKNSMGHQTFCSMAQASYRELGQRSVSRSVGFPWPPDPAESLWPAPVTFLLGLVLGRGTEHVMFARFVADIIFIFPFIFPFVAMTIIIAFPMVWESNIILFVSVTLFVLASIQSYL